MEWEYKRLAPSQLSWQNCASVDSVSRRKIQAIMEYCVLLLWMLLEASAKTHGLTIVNMRKPP